MSELFGRTSRFAVAGVIGFAVDAAVLTLLIAILGPYWARVVSFICAATATWLINRHLTFADRIGAGGPAAEYLRYFAVMLVGGGVNYATYGAIIVLFGSAPPTLYIGLAASSLAGMGINLALAQRFVFSRPRRPAVAGTDEANARKHNTPGLDEEATSRNAALPPQSDATEAIDRGRPARP